MNKMLAQLIPILMICLITACQGDTHVVFKISRVSSDVNRFIVANNLKGIITFNADFTSAVISGLCNTVTCTKASCISTKMACSNASH